VTLKLAVSRSRPSVPYGANFHSKVYCILLEINVIDNEWWWWQCQNWDEHVKTVN